MSIPLLKIELKSNSKIILVIFSDYYSLCWNYNSHVQPGIRCWNK